MQLARVLVPLFVIASTVAVGLLAAMAPSIAAGALLQPMRRPVTVPPPPGCRRVQLPGAGITLEGWHCSATNRRGLIIFLHGIADNRAGAGGVAQRFVARGFDVLAYDSRAHGESGGDACTYGFYEKADLRRVLDGLPKIPVVVIGTSLGAAIALQAAAEDSRIRAVVAAEVFSDLRTVAQERTPFFVTENLVRRALAVAEERGAFEIDRVSPVEAARHITVPVLLIHGRLDTDTNPDHSRRVYANLRGPKQLILADGARHNQSLSTGAIWNEIERWLLESLTANNPLPSQ
jgi:pimeloyl-ACP methyl ester carboxylesterase